MGAGSKFKVGDRVRVLRHRNYMGDEFSDYGIPPGTAITLRGRDETMDGDGFVMFTVGDMGDGFSWLIRSDDIEPIPCPAYDPVRTVTRREIVPGVYGRVEVVAGHGTRIATNGPHRPWSATELREAAHLFTQIAEVLEENAKEAE